MLRLGFWGGRRLEERFGVELLEFEVIDRGPLITYPWNSRVVG